MTTYIDFTPHHRPPIESGEYEIEIKQTISGGDIPASYGSEATTPLAKTDRFYVAGERFTIAGSEINSVFPASESSGDHANVLPHIMLSRTTLPWEREAVPGDTNTPWLGLIVIHENEATDAVATTVALSELTSASTSSPYFPGLTAEPGQNDSDRVAVLDVKKSLLANILPTKADLNNLCLVRQGTDGTTVVGEEMTVLIANRLPQNDGKSTAYLVSLEGRYDGAADTFNYHNAGDTDTVRLITLYSWQFYDEVTIGDFAGILQAVDRTTATLRLPDTTNASTNTFLGMGFYPLPYKMRQGTSTVSWYHGPLAPLSNTESVGFPVQSADALLRYYKQYAMYDVSYAAAWELGKLLALQNNSFATELYRWKRQYAQAQNKQAQLTAEGTGHLKGGNNDTSTPAIPTSVSDWLGSLELLKGVPFNYLVPDAELLPAESIRFFQLDRLWMESLQDGALSIGRVTSSDHLLDQTIAAEEISLTAGTVSGFILRSKAVKGWPGMLIEGYSGTPDNNGAVSGPLTLLRSDYLADNVRLCLFSGDLQTLDLHLKPEVLHYGVNVNGSTYEKTLRDSTGLEVDDAAYTVTVPIDGNSVVDSATLISNISAKHAATSAIKWNASPTSATLALQLIEGVERVRFTTAS